MEHPYNELLLWCQLGIFFYLELLAQTGRDAYYY